MQLMSVDDHRRVLAVAEIKSSGEGIYQSFASRLAGHSVKWFTDTQGVVHIVSSGSRKPHLQDGAMAIFELCFQHSIKLEMDWIPRSFASSYNALLPRFHSRFWSPGCEAVDIFTVNWGNELNWWVPPLHLICRTIRHASQCRAKGTMIIPAWKSAPFWPIICPDGQHLAPFIHQWWPLEFYPTMFQDGRGGSNLGNALNPDCIVLALFIDFSVPLRLNNCRFCTLVPSAGCELCS